MNKRYVCSCEYLTDKTGGRFRYMNFTVNAPNISKAKDKAKEKFNAWAINQKSDPQFTNLYCLG